MVENHFINKIISTCLDTTPHISILDSKSIKYNRDTNLNNIKEWPILLHEFKEHLDIKVLES